MSEKNISVYIEQLDDNVIEMLSEDIGNPYALITENGMIVNALNEINGKDIIASTFGEPILNTDSFDEMSSKIQGIITEFKTQLLGKGVVTSKYDKIQSLINKINFIPQVLSNSKYASGSLIPEYSTTNNDTISFITGKPDTYTGGPIIINDLGFIPRFFMSYRVRDEVYLDFALAFRIDDENTLFITGCCMDSNNNTENDLVKIFKTNEYAYMQENALKIPAWFYELCSAVPFNWYAFGDIEISDEEKALTESLSELLTEKGISVSSEDELSNLIVKVDELWGVDEKNQIVTALSNKGISIDVNASVEDIINAIESLNYADND
jgi:hypothetical protein